MNALAILLYNNAIGRHASMHTPKPQNLLEPMDMPDPRFPMKVHHCRVAHAGMTAFDHHWHHHLEFLYIVDGSARITCNSESFDVSPGELIVVNSTDLHHGISLSDDLFYYAVIVDPSLLHSHTPDSAEAKFITPITQSRIRFAHKVAGDDAVRVSLLSLIEEYDNGAFGYELAVKSWLYRLLTLLLRGHVAMHLTPDQYDSRVRRLERMDAVFRYIEDRYADKISIDELAAVACLSRFHFGRVFKELTNRSVTDYINFVRINKSEYDLRHTSKSITEIALATGFSDVYYFSRLFKAYKNVPPSALRDSHAES